MILFDPRLFDPRLFDTGAVATIDVETWAATVAVRRHASVTVAVQRAIVVVGTVETRRALAVTVER